MSEFIRLQANGVDAYPDASTENTYRSNGTSVESALLALESNVNTLGGVAGEAKTLAEQNSVKIATAEQEISDINSSLNSLFSSLVTEESGNTTLGSSYSLSELLNITCTESGLYELILHYECSPRGSSYAVSLEINDDAIYRYQGVSPTDYAVTNTIPIITRLIEGDIITLKMCTMASELAVVYSIKMKK